MNHSRITKYVKYSAILILITVLLVEAGLRLYPGLVFVTPQTLYNQSVHYEAAPFMKKRIRRQARVVNRSDGITYNFNSYGYRSPEFANDKTRYRIAVYGGSGAFDPVSPTPWPELLQKELQKKNLDVEVINAGIPGDSTAEIAGRFLTEAGYIKPDMVLFYESWNDIAYFGKTHSPLNFEAPYSEFLNAYLFHDNFLDAVFSENSRIYLILRNRYLKWKFAPPENQLSPYRNYTYSSDDFPSELNTQYARQTEANTRSFIEVAETFGIKPVVVQQALLVTGHNSPEEKIKIDRRAVKLNYEGLTNALHLIQTAIAKAAKEKKVSYIKTDELFGKDELYFDHVHFYQKGSQALAKLVANQLAPLITEKPVQPK